MKPLEIKELYESGVSGYQIAKMIGVHRDQVYKALRLMGVPIKKRRDYTHRFYIVYDEHENVVTSGTSDECAAFWGIKKASFYSAVCPSRDKRCKARRWYAVRVEDDQGTMRVDE